MAIVQRGGSVKTKPIANVTAATLQTVIRENVHPSARVITDELKGYIGIGKHFEKGHKTVRHGKKEYVVGDIHSNTVEGFFSTVKRGINGIYHAVSKEHLHRYMSEFEFRYNHREVGDGERTRNAIRAADGKRLTYKQVLG